MHAFLGNLYGHQAWADAEHWRAFAATPAALEDDAIRRRLEHILQCERAFLCLARGEEIAAGSLEYFPDMGAMREDYRRYHAEAAAFLDTVTEARLGDALVIPWLKDPPARITVAEALVQAAMHSHYHRAQNASRLRELGGQPPLTDLILWYWKGRPDPSW
jgi:uncharacterized damage-inducible protein DinB